MASTDWKQSQRIFSRREPAMDDVLIYSVSVSILANSKKNLSVYCGPGTGDTQMNKTGGAHGLVERQVSEIKQHSTGL